MAQTQTPFLETEALLAVMEDRIDDARDILAGLLPGELRTFERQVGKLAGMIYVARQHEQEST